MHGAEGLMHGAVVAIADCALQQLVADGRGQPRSRISDKSLLLRDLEC